MDKSLWLIFGATLYAYISFRGATERWPCRIIKIINLTAFHQILDLYNASYVSTHQKLVVFIAGGGP